MITKIDDEEYVYLVYCIPGSSGTRHLEKIYKTEEQALKYIEGRNDDVFINKERVFNDN